jgi:hypothetical protein
MNRLSGRRDPLEPAITGLYGALAITGLCGALAAVIAPATAAAEPVEAHLGLQEFTGDELFAAGGGGCGMTLGSAARPGELRGLFFSNTNGAALIKLDGRMTWLTRVASRGELFYGQQPSQTYVSRDGSLKVEVTVELGEASDEVIAIPAGTVRIERAARSLSLPVRGDAGC